MIKQSLLTGLTLLVLTACSKEFGPSFQKGSESFDKKNYIEAIDQMNFALPSWSESDGLDQKGKAYEIIGLSYHKLRKIDKAIDAYDKATQFSDKTHKAAYNLGSLYLASNQPNLAAKAFKKALRMKKDDPLSLLGLGNVYFGMGQHKIAKLNYQRIIDTSPGVKEALEHLKLLEKKKRKPTKKKKTQKKRGQMKFRRGR